MYKLNLNAKDKLKIVAILSQHNSWMSRRDALGVGFKRRVSWKEFTYLLIVSFLEDLSIDVNNGTVAAVMGVTSTTSGKYLRNLIRMGFIYDRIRQNDPIELSPLGQSITKKYWRHNIEMTNLSWSNVKKLHRKQKIRKGRAYKKY